MLIVKPLMRLSQGYHRPHCRMSKSAVPCELLQTKAGAAECLDAEAGRAAFRVCLAKGCQPVFP